ncbi:MAG: transposase [Rubrivivax sp.]|jgi:transposase
MSEEDLEDLKRRLVVGHKRGGRCIYDEAAKAELVEMCRQPGASVSRLARECGINANQVSRWLREDASRRKRSLLARCTPGVSPFVAVPVLAPGVMSPVKVASDTAPMSLQARLPNGVSIELCGADLCQLGELIQALGRLPCSA